MSHEKTKERDWDTVDSTLEKGSRGAWEDMTDRERAEKVEELREKTPEKDLRVKALEDRDMVEFSDISEEELNPESYSDLKEYGLGLLDPEVRGAGRKLEDEREEVRELREKHEDRADTYSSARKLSGKIRAGSAVTGIPSTFGSVAAYAGGEPLLGTFLAAPITAFFASFPAEVAFEKLEDRHRHHGNYVRTKEFDEEAYPLFDAADVVIASKEGERNLFQEEAREIYDILNDEAELVHAAEIEDYNPEEDPYVVDLRIDAHPMAGEESTEEPAEEIQYVLVGGEGLEEAYKDLTRP